jgi:hypothetical protein
MAQRNSADALSKLDDRTSGITSVRLVTTTLNSVTMLVQGHTAQQRLLREFLCRIINLLTR